MSRCCGEGNCREKDCPSDVAGEQHGPASVPVNPDPRYQAEKEEGSGNGGVQNPQLEGGASEQEDGCEWYCEFAELCSEAGDGLGRPESEKVGVPPEALLRYDF